MDMDSLWGAETHARGTVSQATSHSQEGNMEKGKNSTQPDLADDNPTHPILGC